MTADLEQRRRTVRVLQLLAESHASYMRGDLAGCGAAVDEAIKVDTGALVGIQLGMTIGEIPHPDNPDAWLAYVRAAEDALADAEQAEGGDDGL